MSYIDPSIEKWEYEERVRWLQRLHGSRPDGAHQGQFERLTNRILYQLGGSLVTLGQQLQAHHTIPAATIQTDEG
jgi:hypothetical protein